jgi:hypothetical protein
MILSRLFQQCPQAFQLWLLALVAFYVFQPLIHVCGAAFPAWRLVIRCGAMFYQGNTNLPSALNCRI